MKPTSLRPADLAFTADGRPFAPGVSEGDLPASEALAQARHVFLRGNGLPARWAGRERFVILDTGFGLGHNFLATWDAWRNDPQRCERLVVVAVEEHPLTLDDLARVHARVHARLHAGVHAAATVPGLATQLIAQWPLPTPNLHLLDFEGGRVQLILAFGPLPQMLTELQADVDAVFLGGFASGTHPAMGTREVFQRIARLAAPGCTVATSRATPVVLEALAREGFEVSLVIGSDGLQEITVGRHVPRFVAPRPAAFRAAPVGPREAVVIGGGLAGCAAAWALAQQGWSSTVLDCQPHPAMGTSGNPAGLMHGIFNAPDSLHARWFRAAALHTARWAAPALAAGRMAGQLDGLLRLDARFDTDDGLQQALAACAQVGLSGDYVQALTRPQAAARAGRTLPSGGWWYGGAGWLSPPGWCAELLAQGGDAIRWQGGCAVAAVRRAGRQWQALDADGVPLAEAPVLVLAHGLGAAALWPDGLAPLRLTAVRGQTTLWPATGLLQPQAAPPASMRVPLSGQGYALPLPDGRLLLGATSQVNDMGASLRVADHRHNLLRAMQLGGVAHDARLLADDAALAALDGRVGWRALAPDRLPVIGPPVDAAMLASARAGRHRLDALRHQPRCHAADHGLYIVNGLASRGLTSAALGARVLAAWISGAPFPVENSLRDALDPARLARGGLAS